MAFVALEIEHFQQPYQRRPQGTREATATLLHVFRMGMQVLFDRKTNEERGARANVCVVYDSNVFLLVTRPMVENVP